MPFYKIYKNLNIISSEYDWFKSMSIQLGYGNVLRGKVLRSDVWKGKVRKGKE